SRRRPPACPRTRGAPKATPPRSRSASPPGLPPRRRAAAAGSPSIRWGRDRALKPHALVIARSPCDEAIQLFLATSGLLRRFAPRNDDMTLSCRRSDQEDQSIFLEDRLGGGRTQ